MSTQHPTDEEFGHGTGDINQHPKMGDYSGVGRAGGLGSVGGGLDRDETEYRAGGATYDGDGGQSGSQAGGLDPAGRADGDDAARRSDGRLRDDVREALARVVDSIELDVQVIAGEVTLTGTVANLQARCAAEDCAGNVAGIRRVHNQLGTRS